METDRLFQVLDSIHPLSEDFKKSLEKELLFVNYPKGHFLIQALSVAHHAYFLDKGFAVAYHYHENRKIVTAFWQAGEIILSPKSFFEQSPSIENIQLTIDGELRGISYSSATKLFESFRLANLLAHVVVSRYHAKSEERIIDLHNLDAWERYTKLVKRYPRIELYASQDLIASYLNITPQSLSRLKNRRNKS
jgi:CRP-like cAMP-binding protein